MEDPVGDHRTERGETLLAGGKIERHVKTIAALPIVAFILLVEDVNICSRRQSEHGDKRGQRPASDSRDGFLIGGQERAFMERELLRPEEQLPGTQNKGIAARIQRIPKNEVHKLV